MTRVKLKKRRALDLVHVHVQLARARASYTRTAYVYDIDDRYVAEVRRARGVIVPKRGSSYTRVV